MSNRRNFIQKLGLAAGAFSANSLFNQAHAAEFQHINLKKQALSPIEIAADEDYWSVVQQGYTASPNIINLNNGGVSPCLLYTSPSPRDRQKSRMPSSA